MVRELKFEKIIETCIYSTDLNVMKDFYVNRLGLDLISEEPEFETFLCDNHHKWAVKKSWKDEYKAFDR